MSPRFVNKELRKKEIALVALDLFAEKGFETTSINTVAQAAGIGKGTVYEYFSSKEELIGEAFMAWLDQMIVPKLEEALLNIKDAEERLRTSMQMMTEAFIQDERTVKITISMFQIMLQGGETFSQNRTFRQSFRVMWNLLDDILLKGVAQGVFRPEIARETRAISVNIMAYLDGIALHYMINKDEIDMMEQVNFYLDRLIHYLKPTAYSFSEI